MATNLKWVDPKTVVVKDHVKDKVVRFKYFRDGEFWYETELGLLFPVPLSDVHGPTTRAMLLVEDKAIYFMRWINRYVKTCKEENG